MKYGLLLFSPQTAVQFLRDNAMVCTGIGMPQQTLENYLNTADGIKHRQELFEVSKTLEGLLSRITSQKASDWDILRANWFTGKKVFLMNRMSSGLPFVQYRPTARA
jgi:hypothetical protein